MSITFQPVGVSLSAAWFFHLTYELYGGEPRVHRCARLKVIVCAVPMVIHWKKNILQGIGGQTQPEISLWDVPPQRLRAQWQLGIQNKTTNWISHHYHFTLWPSRMPGSEEWKLMLIYEEEEGIIQWGLTWATGISIKVIGRFITSWSTRGEAWVMNWTCLAEHRS